MSDPNDADVDARLDALNTARSAQIDRCHYRTATRLAHEMKRVARAEGRLHHYVTALHTLMNFAEDLLDPEPGREAAIELIAVLESEDLARQIQPDLSAGFYEYLISRVLPCGYDGLGRASGLALGYNSDGVHETVAEGVQVCRRTGKLECINCFRNYATDVLRAADDLDMALHHARQVIATGSNAREANNDRRWAGASDEVRLLILAGQLAAAAAALSRAETFIATYHNPTAARLRASYFRTTLAILADPAAVLTERSEADESPPPNDEYPRNHLNRELNVALQAALRGNPAAATATLTPWDRLLSERGALDLWFEVRLRLVAAARLGGDDRRAAALARPLEEKARAARDWLTLRRLARLLDPAIPAHPMAPINPIADSGASQSKLESEPAPITSADSTATDSATTTEEPEPTPLEAEFEAIAGLFANEAGDDPRPRILAAVLAVDPSRATHLVDAARLLHLARVVATDPADGPRIWVWAEAVAAPHPRSATVLNLLAALGDGLRQAEGSLVLDRITPERLERLFRQSLDLDPDDAGNFGRAAAFHGQSGRAHEAERCLARLLRLDRSNAWGALRLAEIYNESDRASDALAVLDMTLRAGGDDPNLAWQAAVLAHGLGQFAVLPAYLDRLEKLDPGRPWVNYYRASGLLHQNQPTEALAALDEEERRQEGPTFATLVLRACGHAALGDLDATRTALGSVLAVRLAEVNNLTHSALVHLAERLWDATRVLAPDDPSRLALAERLLATGLAPNGLFAAGRADSAVVEGLNFYVCEVVQPLGDDWAASPGCLAHEGDWTAYRTAWGVLAPDEAEAERLALAEQARCAPRPATVAATTQRGEGYTEHPGIVWQGLREPTTP